MAVAAVVDNDVQVAEQVGGKCLAEIFDKLRVEVANFGCGEFRPESEGITTTQIDGRRGERFFHWQREVPIALDSGFVSERLFDRLSKADSHILDRMMLVDVQVSAGRDG